MSQTAAAPDVAAPDVAAPPVALDRVMLAMDVVDTLRHRQELVERELDDDRRQRALIERVRKIYDSQGIDVPEAVIADGVRALRENRFVYTPPERSFAVALAEAYVDRRKWALRAALALGLVLAVWAAFAVPAHFRWRALVDSFTAQVARVESSGRQLDGEAAVLRKRLDALEAAATTPASRRLLADADTEVLAADAALAALAAGLGELPAAEDYPDEISRWSGALVLLDGRIAAARAAIGTANGLLGAVRQLGSLRVQLGTVMARLDGVALTPVERADTAAGENRVEGAIDAGDSAAGQAALAQLADRIDGILADRREQAALRARFASLAMTLDGVDVEVAAVGDLQRHRAAVEQAMAVGDWERCRQQLQLYGDLVTRLDRSYELRIVTRPGVQSGVWRYRDGNRRQRNYYIVIEAVDARGAVLALPITSEETDATRVVQLFGVRVPEDVYERVKADKIDNGLIDDALFGTKRRGTLAPQYLFPVAGGCITEW